MKSMQETFDKVVRHLLTQKEVSRRGEGGCAYRGEDGLMCAVGCLIPDENYSDVLERRAADHKAVLGALSVQHRPSTTEEALLLVHLQWCHDESLPDGWPQGLAKVAAHFDLNPTVLQEFQ